MVFRFLKNSTGFKNGKPELKYNFENNCNLTAYGFPWWIHGQAVASTQFPFRSTFAPGQKHPSTFSRQF